MTLVRTLTRAFAATSSLLVISAALTGPSAQGASAAPVDTRIAPLAGGGYASARGDVIAVTQFDLAASSASLLVGSAGAVPTAVPAAGTLPHWAYPHVGTDREGRTVVVYPRCLGTAVKECDLWAYDVARQTATRVAGVNRAGVGETEGIMLGGSVAFTRWTAKQPPAMGGGDATTTLMYKPAGGAARLVTKRGGQQIALAGNQIAQVRDTDSSVGECGQPEVQLLTTAGARRTVRAYRCGMDGHSPRGLTFVRGRLLWVMHALDGGHFAQYVLATHKTYYETADTEFLYSYAPTRTTGGVIVRDGDLTNMIDNWSLDRISGLTYPRGR